MGFLDHISDMYTFRRRWRSNKKPMQTVDIKVRMDCDGCERRVMHALSNMKGVKTVDVNRKHSRVTVSGYLEPNKVLKRVKSTGKRAEFWPYVPYHLVSYPYAAHAYDKKAPSGFVNNVFQYALPSPASASHQHLTSLFSEENPHACSIM